MGPVLTIAHSAGFQILLNILMCPFDSYQCREFCEAWRGRIKRTWLSALVGLLISNLVLFGCIVVSVWFCWNNGWMIESSDHPLANWTNEGSGSAIPCHTYGPCIRWWLWISLRLWNKRSNFSTSHNDLTMLEVAVSCSCSKASRHLL